MGKKAPVQKKKEYYQAIEILSDPFDIRPDTKIVKVLGLGHNRLSDWRKIPHFRKEIAKRFDAKIEAVTPRILKANIHMALLHDRYGFPDRKLYLEMVGRYQPKIRQEQSFDKESMDRVEKILRGLAGQ